MRPLSARDLLRVWESGQRKGTVERALLMLGAALPQMTREELAALSIGERDACLLALREMTLGPALACRVECPECVERLEFTTLVEELRVLPALQPVEHEHTLSIEGFEVRYRLLTSRDLLSVRGADPSTTRALLLRACVLHALHDGREVALEELPEPVAATLGTQIAERDPQVAGREVELECANCQHTWWATLDIASFFWGEISALAKRLLREVHDLARAYGWREADILAMSAARRQAYLELAGE